MVWPPCISGCSQMITSNRLGCSVLISVKQIALALMAVQTQTTEVLDTFPTIPVTQEADQILKEIGQEP